MEQPETRYATSGDIQIAYQVIGDGLFDLVGDAHQATVLGLTTFVGLAAAAAVSVLDFTISDGKIVAIDAIADPARLQQLDLALLDHAEVDIAFLPEVTTLYPPDDTTRVTVEGLTRQLEGASRPGHRRRRLQRPPWSATGRARRSTPAAPPVPAGRRNAPSAGKDDAEHWSSADAPDLVALRLDDLSAVLRQRQHSRLRAD